MPKNRAGNGEGTVYPQKRNGKPTGKWVAEITIGWHPTGKRKYARAIRNTRKEAAAWLAQQRASRETGTLAEPNAETVASFMRRWIGTTAVHEVKARTIQLYREMLDYYIAPAIGHVPLQKLSPQQIAQLYHERLQAGLSPRTVQIIHAVLRRALQQALRWNLIPRNPVDLVKRPRAERPEIATRTPDQVIRFLEAAREDRLHALYTLAATIGLRLGEVLGLRWDDVDLEAGTLTVSQTLGRVGNTLTFDTPKTRASRRTIDLPAVAVQSLRRWRREQAAERLRLGEAWAHPELVFTTGVGTPLNPSNVRNRSFHAILERAGLPRIRFHDLRHSAATMMLSQGVPPRVLQDVLGHSDIRMTLGTYSHVLLEQKKAAAQAVDRLLAAADTKAPK